MRCTSPRTVGFEADGKTLAWSPKKHNKQYATIQLPCGKCLSCRLEYARQWAIRCVHEAQMHPENSFITLTYADNDVKKLNYEDFQKFMKKLRKTQNEPMGYFVTGEYGGPPRLLPNGKMTVGHRPHWHAIIFNWTPKDKKYAYTNHRGDKVDTSEMLTKIWGHGNCDIGTVTFESAGYVARYSAKKLIHGKDDEHEYRPISKKSSKHAIGKTWLIRYYKDVFVRGYVELRDGTRSAIPRYYEKWLKEHRPDDWLRYLRDVKIPSAEQAGARAAAEEIKYFDEISRNGLSQPNPLTRQDIDRKIQQQRFNQLQDNLKL